MVHYDLSKCLTEHLGVVNYVCWTVCPSIQKHQSYINTDLSHLGLGEGEKKCLQFGHYFRPSLGAMSFI